MVGHDMVLKQSFEIFLAPATKQESVDFWPKLLERPVRRGKEGSARMVRSIV